MVDESEEEAPSLALLDEWLGVLETRLLILEKEKAAHEYLLMNLVRALHGRAAVDAQGLIDRLLSQVDQWAPPPVGSCVREQLHTLREALASDDADPLAWQQALPARTLH